MCVWARVWACAWACVWACAVWSVPGCGNLPYNTRFTKHVEVSTCPQLACLILMQLILVLIDRSSKWVAATAWDFYCTNALSQLQSNSFLTSTSFICAILQAVQSLLIHLQPLSALSSLSSASSGALAAQETQHPSRTQPSVTALRPSAFRPVTSQAAARSAWSNNSQLHAPSS